MSNYHIHTVFFWLHSNASDQDLAAFEQGIEKLGTAPSIDTYYWGKSAGSSREVVDGSFDYSLTILFKNTEDHDAYQLHPVHDEFREKYNALWAKVKVYDVLT